MTGVYTYFKNSIVIIGEGGEYASLDAVEFRRIVKFHLHSHPGPATFCMVRGKHT